MYEVGHFNLLPDLSNGLELLNFFAEALQEEDKFGNPLLKDADTVIMDNCGFHHARHVKPVLRNMLTIRGVSLIYQPLYHPQYNTCKLCLRHLNGWLLKHSQFAKSHTDIAIFHWLYKYNYCLNIQKFLQSLRLHLWVIQKNLGKFTLTCL